MTHSQQKPRIAGIQALRAIACLLVLVQHVTFFACYLKEIPFNGVLPLDLGKAGVCLFFAISGFVMGSCLEEGRRFFWNRALRIYPPYWIAIACSSLLIYPIDSTWHLSAWSALLLPTNSLNGSYRIPYWTLCYEIAFYIITYVAILSGIRRSQIARACAAWISAILLIDFFWPLGAPGSDAVALFTAQPGVAILLSPVSIFYATGLLLSTSGLSLCQNEKLNLGIVVTGCSGYLLSQHLNLASPAPQYLVESICFAAMVLGASGIHWGAMISKLGDLSYGAYLFHLMLIVVGAEMVKPLATELDFVVLWIVLMLPTALLSFIYGFLEHRLHVRWLKNLGRNSPVAAPAP